MNFLLYLILTAVFLSSSAFAQSESDQLEGCSDVYTSLVFDEKTGDVLFAKSAEENVYPASLVKVMTLYLTFEAIEEGKLRPDQVLTISERGEEIANVNKITTLHLKEGDTITVRQAIRGVIVKSFNEAAVTLAEAVSGSEWAFVRKMNKKAKELGMINTSYRNASGLHEEGQYTTSYDLARLTKALKRDFPGYYYLFALKKFKYDDKEFETHNHVLAEYKGAEGLKTGFTSASGFNLISAAKKDNSRIISILLACESYQKRDEFTKELLDEAFIKIKKDHNPKLEVKLSKKFDYKKPSNKGDDYESEMRFGMSFLDE